MAQNIRHYTAKILNILDTNRKPATLVQQDFEHTLYGTQKIQPSFNKIQQNNLQKLH